MENILELKNVTKKYSEFTLDNISFSLKRGYIMGFIGENGAGKTTTIKLIMNIISKDGGTIKVLGKDNISFEREVKEKTGFVYDDCFYYENISIIDNAKIFSGFYKEWDWQIFKNYLSKFSLREKDKVKTLSRGNKMKFAIAIALSHKAEFLILDEPTSGLDPVMRRDILDILQDLMEDEKIGILISSHITSDLEKIADYITYIRKGRIVFSESMEEIKDGFKIIKGSKELAEVIDKSLIYGFRKSAVGFEALTNHLQDFDSSVVKQLIVESPTLDEIMIFMNKGGK